MCAQALLSSLRAQLEDARDAEARLAGASNEASFSLLADAADSATAELGLAEMTLRTREMDKHILVSMEGIEAQTRAYLENVRDTEASQRVWRVEKRAKTAK